MSFTASLRFFKARFTWTMGTLAQWVAGADAVVPRLVPRDGCVDDEPMEAFAADLVAVRFDRAVVGVTKSSGSKSYTSALVATSTSSGAFSTAVATAFLVFCSFAVRHGPEGILLCELPSFRLYAVSRIPWLSLTSLNRLANERPIGV
jgi:hypothetical protein